MPWRTVSIILAFILVVVVIQRADPTFFAVYTRDVNGDRIARGVEDAPAKFAAAVPTQVAQPTIAVSNPPADSGGASGSQILTADSAQTWCTGGPCDGRFEQLVEGNGITNPKGVHLQTGDPVSLTIPAGVSGQVWDCFNASQVSGPATLPQVCEATFRAN